MSYKQYSDSYLFKMNKREIIDLLRVAEHNFFAAEEGLQNSARFGAEILAENAELKRLLKLAVEDIERGDWCALCKYYDDEVACVSAVDNCFVWKHADEVTKLIGEIGGNNA